MKEGAFTFPGRAIRLFFQHTLFDVPERRMRRGCMMVNQGLRVAGRKNTSKREIADTTLGLIGIAA